MITGGYSCDGGGIDMKSNITLTLNDVTIGGNRAEQFLNANGYGGGIWVHGGSNHSGKIIMNQSRIIGNYAYNDGGGIYQSNHNGFVLEMHGSSIDRNYCDDEGGGICLDGEEITIKGYGTSSVSYNDSGTETGENGGGIYIWNDEVTVIGLNIIGNRGDNGGGIYSMEKTITISNCVIEDNKASNQGGGIYVNKGETTISSCTILNNTAENEGNGVYVSTGVKEEFNVTGKTIIRDNDNSNIFVEDGSRVNFDLVKGSDVSMKFRTMPDTYKMVTQGKAGDTRKTPNCIRYLSSDVSGYHFSFNSSPSQRKIYLVKDGYSGSEPGSAYNPGDPTVITAEEADEEVRTPVEGITVTGNHDQGKEGRITGMIL